MSSESHARHCSFRTTRWSLVVQAGSGDDQSERQRALSELCEQYWPPLYAYLRRSGFSIADSEDLVQGFLMELLRRDDLGGLSARLGRFRAFLLASLKHYVSNWQDHRHALKRGGGRLVISLDTVPLEQRNRLEPADASTAEQEFDRQWALTLLDRVRDRLHAEMSAEEVRDPAKGGRCQALIGHLASDQAGASYTETGASLGISEAAVKMAVSRMRRRYGQLLRDEISQTLDAGEAVEDEIQYLISVLRR